ncbi:uncharacterized protein RHOBADRAFT_41954 [Rhodotorula graminis WP1]|uniref:Uncharacterized protein n=1 Tax=Rhodotorula graminis (strain WP1) TaxID=578459 RepID=A0A194S828_RHOGW|nr:uncharacterized protein RHOBADRAFT_41954 [Rhodotorula graminis WP1]KPV76747.1 hypothetical protein RHOBADRAFT_41954 [Rhodotorula graminis WP1]
MPRAAHDRQRLEAGDSPPPYPSSTLVVRRLLPNASPDASRPPRYKPQTILHELEERVRALIAHLDKSDDWRHVLPGADRPWKGQFRMPPLNRNGTLSDCVNSSVAVWDSSIVTTCRINNAIVPVIGAPILEHGLKQGHGLFDLWVSGAWTRSTIDVCFRVEWTLKDFHERDVKVVFVTAALNEAGDRSVRSAPVINTIPSTESLNLVSTAASSTRHARQAGGPPSRRSSSGASSLARHSDSSVDVDELHGLMSSPALGNDDSSSTRSSQVQRRKAHPVMTAAELTAHERNPPGVPSMRPEVPQYANFDLDHPSPPPHNPPTVSDSTLRRLEDGIKGFVRYMDDSRAPVFRGQRSGRDQEVHVGDFTPAVARDEHGKGAWVLEVLVHLKGCWTLIRPEVELSRPNQAGEKIVHPFGPLKSHAFCLPGGTLDPRDEHTVVCTTSASRTARAARPARWRAPDQWTFVSRSGAAASDLHALSPHTECHRVLATKWHLRSGVRANKADSHAEVPPVHVTFALDEPFEVRSRRREDEAYAEVFSPGHARRTTARRWEEGHEREGRAFE